MSYENIQNGSKDRDYSNRNFGNDSRGNSISQKEESTNPMTPQGKRVQTLNAPGSETGPGTVATWGRALTNEVDAMGFKWEWNGRSSKHIPFDWSGP
jgi:hypothetical protein